VCNLPLGAMIRKPDEEPPLPPLETLHGPPTQPGWYWLKRDEQSREIMVEVRLTNGELTVWGVDQPIAIAKLTGYWREPIPPST